MVLPMMLETTNINMPSYMHHNVGGDISFLASLPPFINRFRIAYLPSPPLVRRPTELVRALLILEDMRFALQSQTNGL